MQTQPSKVVLATATFKNAAGALADPTAVTFILHREDGLEVQIPAPDSTITHLSTGVYQWRRPITTADVLAGKETSYFVGAKGTGAVTTICSTRFSVAPSPFTNP